MLQRCPLIYALHLCFPHTSQIQRVVVRNQERSETQLHTARVSETAKALGFSRFFVWYPIYGEGLGLCCFSVFWEYPFNLWEIRRNTQANTPSKNTYGTAVVSIKLIRWVTARAALQIAPTVAGNLSGVDGFFDNLQRKLSVHLH